MIEKYSSMSKVVFCSILLVTSLLISGDCRLEKDQNANQISILNNSVSEIVLDCPYNLVEDDTTGLEIKWYFNNKPIPVYQWIPNYAPQDFGVLKGRIDLSHKVSDDPNEQHRALRILKPTSELSGKYSCLTSTFAEVKRREIMLTVYTPASEFAANFEKLEDDSVIISCTAKGIFPQPNSTLMIFNNEAGRFEPDYAESVTTYNNDSSTFDIELNKTIQQADLGRENRFVCVIDIPHSDYELREELHFCTDSAVLHWKSYSVITLALSLIPILVTSVMSI